MMGMIEHENKLLQQITDLISAIQGGDKIKAIIAVKKILHFNQHVPKINRKRTLKQAITVVKENWLDLEDRPAYIAGVFAPIIQEKIDDQEEKAAVAKECGQDRTHRFAGA